MCTEKQNLQIRFHNPNPQGDFERHLCHLLAKELSIISATQVNVLEHPPYSHQKQPK